MSDQINNQNPENQGNNQGNILRELSDIKTSLATNTEATNNMKDNITEIKADIKDIKTKYITFEQHKELTEKTKDQGCDIEELKSFRDTLNGKVWGIGMAAGAIMSILGIIVDYLLRVKL